MSGAILGSSPLGSLVLGAVPSVLPFNPLWASQANIVVQPKRIDS